MTTIRIIGEPAIDADVARAAIESDRVYFELGARKISLDGGEILWVPGIEQSPSSIVVQRVDLQRILAVGPEWIERTEQHLEALGAAAARIYICGEQTESAHIFKAAGYTARHEISFFGDPISHDQSNGTFREVVTESDWARKLQFHRDAAERPDGYSSSAADWVALEKRRCEDGRMRCYLFENEGEAVGAIAAISCEPLLRAKNVVTHPAFRRRGIASSMLSQLGEISRIEGRKGVCIWAMEGHAGMKLYSAAGLAPVAVQTEWSRTLTQRPQAEPAGLHGDDYRNEYRENGFARVTGLFAASEITRFRAEASRLSTKAELFKDPDRTMVRSSEARTDRIDPVLDVSPIFTQLAEDERLLRIAGSVLGGEAQLLKDKFITKPPGDRGYGVHQDVAYWHELGVEGQNGATLAICLDRCSANNGALEFAPGYHHRLLTPPGKVADPDDAIFSHFELLSAEPGDVLLFSALTPHRSSVNRSNGSRRMLFLTYVRDDRDGMYALYQRDRAAFAD